jgi:hemerythrin-like metal-binding protein
MVDLMTQIEWNEGLSLGVEKIDKQHMRLIELANKLIAATHNAIPIDIAGTFHEFREYTVYHFNDEEEYMRDIHYPDLEKHAQQHVELKKQVKHFQDVVYRHGVISEDEVLEFLKNWLIGHIIQNDLAIKQFLATQR